MRPKVFCLGLNKTGTSTFESALRMMGWRVTGPNKGLVSEVRHGRFEAALALTEQYDAFQDFPWPFLLEPVFARYGDSARYVLTVRASGEAWLRSLKNHALQTQIEKIFRPGTAAYGSRYPFGFEAEYLRYYNAHNEHVRRFFEERGASHVFLEACWERGDGWTELAPFLGWEAPAASFPHANATAMRARSRSRQIANGIAAHVLARLNGRRVTDRLFNGPL